MFGSLGNMFRGGGAAGAAAAASASSSSSSSTPVRDDVRPTASDDSTLTDMDAADEDTTRVNVIELPHNATTSLALVSTHMRGLTLEPRVSAQVAAARRESSVACVIQFGQPVDDAITHHSHTRFARLAFGGIMTRALMNTPFSRLAKFDGALVVPSHYRELAHPAERVSVIASELVTHVLRNAPNLITVALDCHRLPPDTVRLVSAMKYLAEFRARYCAADALPWNEFAGDKLRTFDITGCTHPANPNTLVFVLTLNARTLSSFRIGTDRPRDMAPLAGNPFAKALAAFVSAPHAREIDIRGVRWAAEAFEEFCEIISHKEDVFLRRVAFDYAIPYNAPMADEKTAPAVNVYAMDGAGGPNAVLDTIDARAHRTLMSAGYLLNALVAMSRHRVRDLDVPVECVNSVRGDTWNLGWYLNGVERLRVRSIYDKPTSARAALVRNLSFCGAWAERIAIDFHGDATMGLSHVGSEPKEMSMGGTNMRHLQILNVAEADVADGGVTEYIADAPSPQRWTTELAALAPNLLTLDIRGCDVDDHALRAIGAGCLQLRVFKTGRFEPGVAMRVAQPNLLITTDGFLAIAAMRTLEVLHFMWRGPAIAGDIDHMQNMAILREFNVRIVNGADHGYSLLLPHARNLQCAHVYLDRYCKPAEVIALLAHHVPQLSELYLVGTEAEVTPQVRLALRSFSLLSTIYAPPVDPPLVVEDTERVVFARLPSTEFALEPELDWPDSPAAR